MTSTIELDITIFANLDRDIDDTDTAPIQTCVTVTIPSTDPDETSLDEGGSTQWRRAIEEYKEQMESRLIGKVQEHQKLRKDWAAKSLKGLQQPLTEECRVATSISGHTSTAPTVKVKKGTEEDAKKYFSSRGGGIVSWLLWIGNGETVLSV